MAEDTIDSMAATLSRMQLHSPLGQELCDIVKVASVVHLSEKELHAAILGRTGVCSSSWQDFIAQRVMNTPPSQTDRQTHG